MTGYVRQSTANIIAGQDITALPLANEFNALEAAFNSSTGHTHDGTTGNGPLINLTASVVGVLPVANGGTGAANLNGLVQITGAQTITGLKTLSLGTAVTSTDYLIFKPTDYTVGKPSLAVHKNATATSWTFSLFDTVTNAGTINFDSTGLTWAGISLVDLSTAQTLTNKNLSDSTTFIVDNVDTTKKVQFQVSGVTTATTKVLTVPNFDGTIATLAGTETFTNKTLTTPAINGATFSGTLAGSSTVTGLFTISRSNATTLTNYLVFQPTDYGVGKPQLFVNKTATATIWDVGLFDTATNAGTINFIAGTSLTWGGVEIVTISNVQTLTNKSLTSPTLTGVPVAPTAAGGTNTTQIATTAFVTAAVGGAGAVVLTGAQTITGVKTLSIGDSVTALDYLVAQPTDYGVGKPRVSIQKGALATVWNISLYDSVNSAGTINFVSATGLTWNSVQLVDLSTAQTLTTKTLTSPIINGATLSGTLSGGTFTSTSLTNPTLTGTPIAPTAAAGTNTTQVATTAFVQTAMSAPVLVSYTVAGLPSASPAGQIVYVSNGNANRRLGVSDGTNWRFPDGNVVI